jgi:hydrogenase nickel incorporation protein HypB
VVILSTPEGDDKPHKYPLLFTQASALVVNKTDLLPYVGFDIDTFTRAFKGLNQQAALFAISGLTGEGIEEWGKWVMDSLQKLRKLNP